MLYKYRSFDDYKFDQVFKGNTLYFARPGQFNDPFESKPRIVGLDTLEERREYVKEFILRNCGEIGYAERKQLERSLLRRLADQKLVKDDVHALLNKYGILCLSRKWDQILMWSHYAKSHTGICIGFDFSHDLDDDYGVVHDVSYNESYPEVDPKLFGRTDADSLNSLFEATMQTKSHYWSYEEEVRFIRLQSEGGSGVYPFNRNKIKEVILGACISSMNKIHIKDLVEEYAPSAKMYQSTLSSATYSLRRAEVAKKSS